MNARFAAAALTALLPLTATAQTVSSLQSALLPLTGQEYLYIVQSGQPRKVHPSDIAGTLVIPTSPLLGGANNAFAPVSVGSGLSLIGGVLSADLLSITAGCGLTGGIITSTGTIAAAGYHKYTDADGDVQLSVFDGTDALTDALTATRAWTLPPANALAAGCTIKIIVDSTTANSVTPTNELLIAAAGSDTINGSASYELTGDYFAAYVQTDGVSKWTVSSTVNIPQTPTACGVCQRLAIGWDPGLDPGAAGSENIIATIDQDSTVQSIVGTVSAPVGAAATVSVYEAPSGTPCASGTVLHSGSFDANGTAATNQTLTLTTTALPAGDRLCLVSTNGANWTGGVGVGGITVRITTP